MESGMVFGWMAAGAVFDEMELESLALEGLQP
jgi:hypothetical protein